MSACEGFSADNSVDRSAWDSVDSKVFVWEIEVRLFFARLTTNIIEVDLVDRVLALASKRCFLCSAVYSHGVVETKRPFLASFRLTANVKLASIS